MKPPARRPGPDSGSQPREIALLSESLRLLAEARTIDEVKDIRDKAEALRLYIKQQGESLELQNAAAEIKIRAERRAGEMLAELELSRGRPASKKTLQNATFKPPTLEELGIERTQSHRWQRAASVADEVFESHVAATKAAGKELTSASVLRLAEPARPKPDKTAAWTFSEAMEHLSMSLHVISLKWPKPYIGAMAQKLRSAADELMEWGELRG